MPRSKSARAKRWPLPLLALTFLLLLAYWRMPQPVVGTWAASRTAPRVTSIALGTQPDAGPVDAGGDAAAHEAFTLQALGVADAYDSSTADVLARAHRLETRDALWAARAEAEIATVVRRGQLPDGAFVGASCRTTVCKLSLHWPDELDRRLLALFINLSERYADNLGVHYAEGHDSLQAIDVYVARDGYTLRDIAED